MFVYLANWFSLIPRTECKLNCVIIVPIQTHQAIWSTFTQEENVLELHRGEQMGSASLAERSIDAHQRYGIQLIELTFEVQLDLSIESHHVHLFNSNVYHKTASATLRLERNGCEITPSTKWMIKNNACTQQAKKSSFLSFFPSQPHFVYLFYIRSLQVEMNRIGHELKWLNWSCRNELKMLCFCKIKVEKLKISWRWWWWWGWWL